jgi:hypothetical protein
MVQSLDRAAFAKALSLLQYLTSLIAALGVL